ncbi:MAG: transporter substrate-binding domain-containing protein [Clostridia bacterium]|nr:transporter substrate-binding domain-containing protein [Clostridia bacterium]
MKKRILCFLLLFLLLWLGSACAESAGGWIASREDLNGKRMGIVTGTSFEAPTLQYFPDSQYLYFGTNSDVVTALVSNKIDGFLADEPVIRMICKEVPEITYLSKKITQDDYAFGFGKNSQRADRIRGQFNEMLSQIMTNGTLNALYDKWFGDDEAVKTVDLTGFSGENGTLNVVTSCTSIPFSYIKDGKMAGIAIELTEMFCRRYGYTPSIEDVDVAARIPGIVTGKYDMCAAPLTITEERRESINFSDPYYQGGIVLAVRKMDVAAKTAEKEETSVSSPMDVKRMGIVTGTSFEAPTLQFFPSSEYLYYNSYTDVAAALINQKIDGFLGDEPALRILVGEVPEITYLPEKLVSDEYAFGFGKSGQRPDMLRRQFNEMLAEIKADGTLEALGDKWFGEDEAVKVVDLKNGYSGENGKLNVVTTATDVPFSYVKDNQYVGLSIELVEMFCRRFGYTPVIADVDFSARMPGLVSGKYDMCASSMAITEERKESISFSEPFYQGGIVLAVRKADAPAQTAQSADPSGQSTVSGLDALNGKRIGVLTGTTCATEAEARLPDATIVHANNMADELAMLRAGKVDAIVSDEIMLRYLQIENDDLEVLTEKFSSISLAPMFTKSEKGRALCEEYNAFVQKLWADGTMDALQEVWLGKDESLRTVLDYEALPDVNGTLTMAVDATLMPCAYVKDGRIVGYDVDIAARFCEANGYRLKIVNSAFDGVLASVQNGKCDFASCGITITDERAEMVLFGMPILYSGNTAAVLKQKDASSTASAASGYASLQDLNGKRIGVQTGTTFDEIVLETLPDAAISYFNSYPDMAAALEANKIDAFPGDEPVIRLMAAENDKLTVLEDRMDDFDFGIAMPKTEAGEKLLAEINAWLADVKESGELTAITQKWTDGPESEKTVTDYASFPAPNGVLTLATEGAYAPMNYYRSDEVVGLEIDMIARFCEANGYGLKVVPMLFDGILPAIQSGKADFAAAGLTITEERKESVYFSDPYYTGGTVMAILKSKAAASAQQTASAGIASLDDLANARIGVQTGTICGALAEARLPDAQIYYFNTVTDVLAAMNAGKLEAGCMDEPTLRFLKIENPQLVILDEYLDESNLAAVFPKTEAGQTLCGQYSEFLEKLWADGTMKEIDAVWFGKDDGKRTVMDFASLPATNGTLRMAVDLSMIPFTYMKDNKIVGYDVDVAARFCQAYGYALEIMPMDFGGILPSVQSGKCDFASSCITITEERAESVLFSSPNYYGGIAVGVRAESALSSEPNFSGDTAPAVLTEEQQTASSAVQQESFWDGIVASFNKTFIRENRWELFENGVLTTLLITVLSILFGTALGFLVFMLCRNGNIVANGATRFSMWLVQGMPMVVLLMILYYIIFGSVAISGIFVAVIGFTLAFGAAVFGLLKMGVGAIDQGQYEAAYALGYANRRTFFRIILPQAIPHILPAYKGEIVGLIKATAIVGYIAVQDLTKMGDIVRSRTYEAFFPLIAVTVIYFILEGLLCFLVSKIQIRMNPKKRKPENILKGVNIHD